jgi:S-adenosylmethionine-diacylglycerol 3-amino-3-carboxypropyl transferase
MTVRQATNAMRRATSAGLKAAVHRSKPLTRAGVLERIFTLAFERLVYPQIWEDPVVDMAALDIGPGHEIIAIASGGCNVLSYLTADPAGVTAVDLGHLLGAGHTIARLHGLDPSIVLKARSLDEQRALYETRLAPIFEKPLIRWILKQPASLYGLGIPPAQYKALAADSPLGIGAVLSERLERLACGFDIADNYFAWQAFGRRYAPGPNPALPPYLQRENFDAVRSRSSRVHYVQRSFTDLLRDSPPASFDRYVLLDAQDWMNDAELAALWIEITRTARPGARVIFRTAAAERLLPGRAPADVLAAWTYQERLSRDLGRRDRSSIYGAFHLYTLNGALNA